MADLFFFWATTELSKSVRRMPGLYCFPPREKAETEYADFRKLAVKGSGGRLVKLLLPRGSARRNTSRRSRSEHSSCFHQPDLVAASVGLHGRVVPSAEVEVTPAGGCALQGAPQLSGVRDVVGLLGITAELAGGEERGAGYDET